MEFTIEARPGKARKRALGFTPRDVISFVACDDLLIGKDLDEVREIVAGDTGAEIEIRTDPRTDDDVFCLKVGKRKADEWGAAVRAGLAAWQAGGRDWDLRGPEPAEDGLRGSGEGEGSPEASTGLHGPLRTSNEIQAREALVFPHLGKNVVVFDLEVAEGTETHKTFTAMRKAAPVSVANSFDFLDGRVHVYDVNTLPDLVERLKDAAIVVGFNHVDFDYKVLRNSVNGCRFQRRAPKTEADLLLAIWDALGGRRKGWKLDDVAHACLGYGKTEEGGGAMAPTWWQNGRVGQVTDYCIGDVLVTRDLYLYALANDGKIRNAEGTEITISIPSLWDL